MFGTVDMASATAFHSVLTAVDWILLDRVIKCMVRERGEKGDT